MSLRAIVFILVSAFAGSSSFAVTYDASGNTLPGSPWARYDFNHPLGGAIFGFNAPQSVAGGVYEMGPTQGDKYTFWYTDSLVLDNTQIVELSARLRLVSESSFDAVNRAGLALALTDNNSQYSEMYINANEIFLNTRSGSARVRDTSFAMNTTTAFHDYTMRLQGSTITILVDGVVRLTGATFDTTGIALPVLPNWATFGDVTSSSSSTWQMQSMSVNVFVPEPTSICAASIALAIVARRRPRSLAPYTGRGQG